jgi:hypothetical protein
MGLRHIFQRLATLGCCLLLQKLLKPNNIPESLSRAAAVGGQRGTRSDGPVRTHAANSHVTRSSASVPRDTKLTAGASSPLRKHLCAGDVARGILAANPRVSISNILVVGTDGSRPLKRMEIHLDEPELVPAIFKSLATTLQRSGFDLQAAESPCIPATDIWLTSFLDEPNKTLLSCTAIFAEEVAAVIAAQPGCSREQSEQSPLSITMQQPLMREARASRE